jgi:hypothetical protein
MPTYKDLPAFEEACKGLDSTFWGLKGSVEEGRGMLNLLTPEAVLQAKKEIQEGLSIGLNWEMRYLDYPAMGRLDFGHKIVHIPTYPNCLDDEYTFVRPLFPYFTPLNFVQNPQYGLPCTANDLLTRAAGAPANGTAFVTGRTCRPASSMAG